LQDFVFLLFNDLPKREVVWDNSYKPHVSGQQQSQWCDKSAIILTVQSFCFTVMYKVATDYIFLCTNILTEQLYTLRLYKSGFLHYHLDNIGDGD